VALPLVVLLALAGVFCLAPLSLYLSWLVVLNRRSSPTILRGSSDLLGLVFGLSGFLGLGGLVLIGLTHSNARFAMRGNWEQIRAAWSDEQFAWLSVAAVYVLLIIGVIVWLAKSRGQILCLFSVDRWQLESTLDELLTDLGKTATRTGQLWTDGLPILEVQHFEGMYHATVTFHTRDLRFREEIERELRLRLRNAPAAENDSSTWILWASLTTLFMMSGCLFLVLYYLYLSRR
jgi:hypothetical protein